MIHLRHTLGSAAAALLIATSAAAQHDGDMVIGADASGGGTLAIEFDFASKVKTTFTADVAGTSVYTATEPGFDALDTDEPLESFYTLAPGTTVSVEITRLDAGKTAMKLNGVTLDAVGESTVLGTAGGVPPNDLHHHPELQLLLLLAPGEFGEGQIGFKLTTSTVGYSASQEYTLTLTNGHLAGVAYDSGATDSASVACQKTVAKNVGKFTATQYKLLAKCLDKVQAWKAREAAAHSGAAAAQTSAEAACADAAGTGDDAKTMLGRILAARQKAVDAIVAACGASGSGDYPETNDVLAHLNLAKCRTEELISASYGFAKANLSALTLRASQGGGPLDGAFPCLVPAAEEEEAE